MKKKIPFIPGRKKLTKKVTESSPTPRNAHNYASSFLKAHTHGLKFLRRVSSCTFEYPFIKVFKHSLRKREFFSFNL